MYYLLGCDAGRDISFLQEYPPIKQSAAETSAVALSTRKVTLQLLFSESQPMPTEERKSPKWTKELTTPTSREIFRLWK